MIDGKPAAQLKGAAFTAVSLPPGRHVLRANLVGPGQTEADAGEAAFDVAPGAAIAFRATVKMKLTSGGVGLTRIEDLAVAKARLAKMKMVAPD